MYPDYTLYVTSFLYGLTFILRYIYAKPIQFFMGNLQIVFDIRLTVAVKYENKI